MPRYSKRSSIHKLSRRIAVATKRKAETELQEDECSSRFKIAKLDEDNISLKDFEAIILMRKAKLKAKAELRRHEGIKLIADRNAARRSDRPLKLFPKKVWENILSHLENPLNLANMSIVHPIFHELLGENYRQKVLLPQVLSIVRGRPIDWSNPVNRARRIFICSEIFPVILVRIYEFRKVCKSFRNAIDRWYEGNIRRAYENGEYDIPCYFINIDREKDLLNMLKRFCNGPVPLRAKKFFLRSLEIRASCNDGKSSTDRDMLRFEKRVTSFLKVVGDQVLNFIFKYKTRESGEDGRLLQICAMLWNFLPLMPNLELLEIDFGSFTKKYVGETQLASVLNGHAIPLLKNLKRVWFNFDGEAPEDNLDILVPILRANPHIRSLQFSAPYENQIISLQKLLDKIQRLPLHLESFSIDGTQYESILPEVWHPLVIANWKLKTLDFCLNWDLTSTLVSAFRFINNFPTLENLIMEAKKISIGGGVIPSLKLPNLINFKIAFQDEVIDYSKPANVLFFYSLEFLLESKKLKSLTWRNGSKNTDRIFQHFLIDYGYLEDKIRFSGGHRDLKLSNIWKVFPELTQIKVHLVTTIISVVNETERCVVFKEYRKSNAKIVYGDVGTSYYYSGIPERTITHIL